MKRYIPLFLITFLSSGFSNGDIDFKNKRLLKEIPKTFGEPYYEMVEFPVPDSLRYQLAFNGKFFSINTYKRTIGFSYIGRVNTCRAGGCSLTPASDAVEFEYFDYFILFSQTLTVKSVRVFNYQATHGHEITAKNWLKQFIGYDGSQNLEVGKNIDSISGATMSAYSITYDVENVSGIMRRLAIL